jgi:hypothetical protein
MNLIPLQGHLTCFSGPARPAAIPRFGHMPEASNRLNDLPDDFHKTPLDPPPVNPSKPRHGKFKNNALEFVGITLLNILPLGLAAISMAGWPGFLLSLALMPVLYLTGKLGRSVRQHVNPDDLVGPFKLFHKLHDLLHPTLSPQEKQALQERLNSAPTPQARQAILKELGSRDHTDKINQALSDFLATAKIPKAFGFLKNEQIRFWLLNTLRVDNRTWFGKALNRYINNGTLFRNQIFSGISNSETLGGAFKVGAKGAKDGFVDFVLMPKIGRLLEQYAHSPLCPGFVKLALVPIVPTLKNWFTAKSFVDLTSILQMARGNASSRPF